MFKNNSYSRSFNLLCKCWIFLPETKNLSQIGKQLALICILFVYDNCKCEIWWCQILWRICLYARIASVKYGGVRSCGVSWWRTPPCCPSCVSSRTSTCWAAGSSTSPSLTRHNTCCACHPLPPHNMVHTTYVILTKYLMSVFRH